MESKLKGVWREARGKKLRGRKHLQNEIRDMEDKQQQSRHQGNNANKLQLLPLSPTLSFLYFIQLSLAYLHITDVVWKLYIQ